LEKQIDNLIEHKKSLWTTLIVLNGGLAGLLLTFSPPLVCPINITKAILLSIGLFLDYLFLEGLFNINQRINDLLK
jgi:hypothetical protein